ncbi:MAG: Maf-like protein [Planctomycetes bacterium]|nr:Maf-like protein [Planctomycetota bacterium]
MPIVLASSSETRRRLLSELVARFEVVEPGPAEADVDSPEPEALVRRRAEAKAREVSRRPGSLVIGADTAVVCRGELMGKPRDRDDALRMLRSLSRHPQRVLTGMCVIAPDGRRKIKCASARTKLREMGEEELAALADRPGILDKAGGFELQADDPDVAWLEGSESAVMGLALEELREMLCEFYPLKGGSDGPLRV